MVLSAGSSLGKGLRIHTHTHTAISRIKKVARCTAYVSADTWCNRSVRGLVDISRGSLIPWLSGWQKVFRR